MEKIKVGDVVLIKSKEYSTINGCTGIVRYANTRGNLYFVGNFSGFIGYSAMDVTREQMTVLTKKEYPELYI